MFYPDHALSFLHVFTSLVKGLFFSDNKGMVRHILNVKICFHSMQTCAISYWPYVQYLATYKKYDQSIQNGRATWPQISTCSYVFIMNEHMSIWKCFETYSHDWTAPSTKLDSTCNSTCMHSNLVQRYIQSGWCLVLSSSWIVQIRYNTHALKENCPRILQNANWNTQRLMHRPSN